MKIIVHAPTVVAPEGTEAVVAALLGAIAERTRGLGALEDGARSPADEAAAEQTAEQTAEQAGGGTTPRAAVPEQSDAP